MAKKLLAESAHKLSADPPVMKSKFNMEKRNYENV